MARDGSASRGRFAGRGTAILGLLLGILAVFLGAGNAWSDPDGGFKDLSDQDRDGDVDVRDLEIFSRNKLERNYTDIDWAKWVQRNQKWSKHYYRLFTFIYDYYDLDGGDRLAVRNAMQSPSRLAMGPDGSVFVSDPAVGSVFVLDSQFQPKAEFRGFENPVGIAVDSDGNLYVGDDGTNRVEKYGPTGRLLVAFGAGLVRKPVDLALDSGGNVYVADAECNVVWVFKGDGSPLRTIRRGGLNFPVAVAVAKRTDSSGAAVEEVYVLDQRNFKVRVYDLQGELQRSLGGFPPRTSGMGMGGFGTASYDTTGYFVSPQSLLVDGNGKLHVLDTFLLGVQILDPVTGEFSESYGKVGAGTAEFRLPVDILRDGSGRILVSDPGNVRVAAIR